MRDQIVDVDLLVHVPVDDLRHIRAPARTAESSALPHPSRDELERPGLDLLTRASDANDHRDAPASMAALERLAHEIDVADALEAVVRATVGETHEVLYEIALDLLGVDEVGHAKFLRERLAPWIDVDTDDLVRSSQTRALDDIQSDAPQAEHHDVCTGLDLGSIDHCTDPGGDAAADVADLVERRVLADLRDGDLREHRVIGERRTAHVVMHHVLADRKAAAAIGHQALALGGTDCGAQVGLTRQARFALPALRRVERDHVIPLLHRRDPWSDIDDDTGALVSEDDREQSLGIGARTCELIRVTYAARVDLDQHLARLGSAQIYGDHFEWLAGGVRDRSFGLHPSPRYLCARARGGPGVYLPASTIHKGLAGMRPA